MSSPHYLTALETVVIGVYVAIFALPTFGIGVWCFVKAFRRD